MSTGTHEPWCQNDKIDNGIKITLLIFSHIVYSNVTMLRD
jgi:hypothetical protein